VSVCPQLDYRMQQSRAASPNGLYKNNLTADIITSANHTVNEVYVMANNVIEIVTRFNCRA